MMKWKVAFAAMIAAVAVGGGVISTSGGSVDAGVTNAVSIDCGACTFAAGTPSVTVDIEFTNNSGSAITVGAFNFNILGDNQALLTPNAPVCSPPGTDCNPNSVASGAGWSCGPPNPVPDADPGAGSTNSQISCFNGSGDGPSVADGATVALGQLTLNVTGTGVGNLTLDTVNIFDSLGVEVHACAPGAEICNNATVQIGASAATNTPTAPPTSTNTPVATATPCQGTACPTRTTLAFITVTPTASATVPPSATVPAPADTPVPGATQPGGGTAPGGGGGGTITLPDTGTGSTSSNSSLGWALSGLAMAAMLAGGLVLNLAGATSRREGK